MQTSEAGRIDSPFDRDGDNTVDASNPECAQAYASPLLDCDDSDPAISPLVEEFICNGIDDDCDPGSEDAPDLDIDGSSACEDCDDSDPTRSPALTEACWDGIDNDCDGQIDPGCIDYQGSYMLEPPVVYPGPEQNCVVDVALAQFELSWNPPEDLIADNPTGRPTLFLGTVTEDGAFFILEASVVLGTFGSCDEYYRFSGQFVDAEHFVAEFEVNFEGNPSDFWCGPCEDQLFSELSGLRLSQ